MVLRWWRRFVVQIDDSDEVLSSLVDQTIQLRE